MIAQAGMLDTQDELSLWKMNHDRNVPKIEAYLQHLAFKQVTFGKACRVLLTHSGKVMGEGLSKKRHFH